MSVATIISFCTNDCRFLTKCVQEALHFSDQVIIPVCDHFFDGSLENRQLLHWAYQEHPDCQFIEFPYSHKHVYPTYFHYNPDELEWAHHWHSFARLMGFYYVDPRIEWILFLDCDEIPDGKRFSKSLDDKIFSDLQAVRLGCYYYVLKPNLRATKIQELSLFVRKDALEPRFFYHTDERYAVYQYVRGQKLRGVRGSDGFPLIHHYSWVRPKSECIQKSKTWGHRFDRNWNEIIQDTFRQKGSPFGADLEFEEISSIYFDPLSVDIPSKEIASDCFSNVIKLTYRDYMRLELNWDLRGC